MNEELKLKPCPFCGGEVRMDNEQITATITVDYFICEKCGATVHFEYADKTAESIGAWNTRKPIDNIVEQLENASCYVEDGDGHAGHFVFTDDAIEIVKGGGNE